MLNAYLAATENLLQNPAAPNPLYTTANLTTYINTARGQLAGEGQCIRVMGTFSTALNTVIYPFSSFYLGAVAGVAGVLNVRNLWIGLTITGTQVFVKSQTFEEYSIFALNQAMPYGQPNVWAQYGQGATGSLYVYPTPSGALAMQADCVCYPSPLASDSDPEAIPYLWTDAVPYFAAYLALLSSQTTARSAEADKMLERYRMFVDRARYGNTPGVMPWQQPQNPVMGGINPQTQQRGG